MLVEALKKPKILFPKKHILLLSHMRANTTLLGHIFGSHAEVSGYYEHHIGYYSWKSLLREKIKFAQENPKEPVTQYYFDKILHNEHYVDSKIWQAENVALFFMLRQPERSIKSIVRLYQKFFPTHEWTAVVPATEYYINRLKEIEKIAIAYSQYKKLYYLDSESLVKDTASTLAKVSKWFALSSPLTAQYRLFDLSGKEKYGDSSTRIKQGYVNNKKANYDDIIIEPSMLEQANMQYQRVRALLLSLAHESIAI